MKIIFTLLFFCLLPSSGITKEEIVQLSEDRRVAIVVPDGYHYSTRRDEQGIISAQIVDAGRKINLQVIFLPDPQGLIANETGQKDFLASASQPYAEGSVERSYDFKPLEPRSGSGLYCRFTDVALAKSNEPPPPGEFLYVTTGIKAWPGCFLLFTLLSNETTSKEYETGLKLIKESFDEKKKPSGPLI